MNPWFGAAAVVLASVVMIAIRAPYGHRSQTVPVVKHRKGPREIVLLTFAWIAFFVPFVWMATPVLAFADYPLHPVAFGSGVVCLAVGLWLFQRSHVDLGRNWSITLEIREEHQLISRGVYRRVRHPMYTALLLYSIGNALVLPNWLAGPAYPAAMIVLFAFRVGPEERMLIEQFGREYENYMATTKRLVPGIW